MTFLSSSVNSAAVSTLNVCPSKVNLPAPPTVTLFTLSGAVTVIVLVPIAALLIFRVSLFSEIFVAVAVFFKPLIVIDVSPSTAALYKIFPLSSV